VIALLGRVTELERTVATQRDEIARLKGVPGRPTLKPSGMEKATQPTSASGKGKHGQSGKKTARRVIHEDRVIKAALPTGSRFKGYEDFVVQDLVLRPHVVRYRRERWLAPDGRSCRRCPLVSTSISAPSCVALCVIAHAPGHGQGLRVTGGKRRWREICVAPGFGT